MTSSVQAKPPGLSQIGDVTMTDMSTSSETDPSAKSQSIEELKTALYNHCASQPSNTIFSQADLMATSLIPSRDPQILLTVTQSLTRSGHLRLMQRNGTACWRCVSSNFVTAQASLDPDAALVYSHIESAGREGVWSNQLNRRTNFHKVVMDKCIKVLEHKRLIKTVPNFRHPNRRTYMLWGLQPAEDVTGGPFYNEGELDEEFVRQMSLYIERLITGRSWWFPPHKSSSVQQQQHARKRKHDGQVQNFEANPPAAAVTTREDAEKTRTKALEKPMPAVGQGRQRSKHMRPFPPGYTGYPTIPDITNALNEIKISKTTMKFADVQILVDVLVWDGKVERLKKRVGKGKVREMYRAMKHPIVEQDATDEGAGVAQANAFTEAPCGRCPVFDVCEDGGLVSARTCPYFQEWLDY